MWCEGRRQSTIEIRGLKGPSIGDRGQADQGMTRSEGLSNLRHRERMHGQGTKDLRVVGQAGLRGVNVTQAWRKAEIPNGTFESDDIRRMMTGKGVIVLVSVGERLEEIFDSDHVR